MNYRELQFSTATTFDGRHLESGASFTLPVTRSIDFVFQDAGSIWLLHPKTDEARYWVAEHLPVDHQTWGSAVVVEHNYVADICTGIHEDGLRVSLSVADYPVAA